MISGRSCRNPVVGTAADAHHGQHGLDADQLQGDVGHDGQDAGEGHGEGQPPGPVPAVHEVCRGDVAVHPGHRPQPGQEYEHDRVDHDRVGQGEESGCPGAEDQGRHRDECVGSIQIAAE